MHVDTRGQEGRHGEQMREKHSQRRQSGRTIQIKNFMSERDVFLCWFAKQDLFRDGLLRIIYLFWN